MTSIRVAICNDFLEEGWPSMDRVAAMLYAHLRQEHRSCIDAAFVCPRFIRRATALPGASALKVASNADRFLNRFHDYPQALARIAADYDVFHIVDHSYAHLARALPADRAVVTCHDLDAFRSVIVPGEEPRSAAFRRKTSEIMDGLRRAACVTCDTSAIRDELVARRLVVPSKTVVAPLGVSDTFTAHPDSAADAEADRLAPRLPGAVELLHVGSCVPRKRIDVLLDVFAALARRRPDVRLVHVGDPLTCEQRAILRRSSLEARYTEASRIDESVLAAFYRRAALVLLPSEREGFGLPLVEALACGAPVVASDLSVLREVGGSAVEYRPVGDVNAWVANVEALLRERETDPRAWLLRTERGLARAARFTWTAFAVTLACVYADVAARVPARQPAIHQAV